MSYTLLSFDFLFILTVRFQFNRKIYSFSISWQTVLEKLKVAEDHARKSHLNIWRYGDIPDDDLDEPEVWIIISVCVSEREKNHICSTISI